MSIIRSNIIFIGISLFLFACGTAQRVDVSPAPAADTATDADIYWAKDQFDLQRVGPLLERSHSPQEFETYLNDDGGINNLDLNGDGYADYISVDEFYDGGPYERGLSVYDRFGPDLVQEIARIFFYRDDPAWSGARLLVVGNDNIYGDNVYYETNWFDRRLDLVNYVYSAHDPYSSPYYVGYYPPQYTVYEVVERPVYVTRVQRLFPEPVLALTERPTFLSKIKIKSPHADKHFNEIYAKLAKPTKEQQMFWAESRGRKLGHQKPEQVKNVPPGQVEIPPGHDKDDRRVPPRMDRKVPPGHDKARDEGKPPAQSQPQAGPPAKVAKANPPKPQPAKPAPQGGGKPGQPPGQGGSKGKKKG